MLPPPRLSGGGGGAVSIRLATETDIPFIDHLQKMHSHMVGWFPTKQIEAYVKGDHVLIAEDQHRNPLGYCSFKDQYLKRDDVGIVYQLNVLPLKQRGLIGASLVKAAFDRSAYGCKLFCCWCAQDIQANYFWESIGFIPLAFRTGSRSKQRIHIFWQRRVRDNDDSTPYWFPSQTSAGAVNEERIVLPIPHGTHWRDAKPLVLPGVTVEPPPDVPKTLPGGALVRPRPQQPKLTASQKVVLQRIQSKHLGGVPIGKTAIVTASGIKYVDRTDYVPETDAPEGLEPPKPKRPRNPKPRAKNDPKYVKAARELRDRFLEQVNSDRLLPGASGKYDVSRQLESTSPSLSTTRLLDAA
jgi:hypothetical protein